jgi:Bifunctional DNA primase/polymerase, N-terminal
MIEALAHAGVPTIPVRVYQDPDGQWKKEPLRKWGDEATTNRDILVGWWRSWPDAKPGVPLKRLGWVAIDLDDYEDAAFRAAWVKPEKVVTRKGRSFVEPEHYSIYKTPSGGRHIVFAQPDPPLAGRMQWSPGVEVLAWVVCSPSTTGTRSFIRAWRSGVFCRRCFGGRGMRGRMPKALNGTSSITMKELRSIPPLKWLWCGMRCSRSTPATGAASMMRGCRWPTRRSGRA